MRVACHLAAAFTLTTLAAFAQAAQPKPELFLFHPSGAPLSYDVATIKPIDPEAADRQIKLPPGATRSTFLSPLTMRRYIMNAYGAASEAQVVGGPDWLNKDAYQITGKAPGDLEAAFRNMKFEDRGNQIRAMQQSLLADRFHLKAHFETRVLPVYEMVPAKSGLKIAEVPAPPERKAGDPPPPPARPGGALPPGFTMTMVTTNGLRTTNGRAVRMQVLARIVGSEVGDRPIVDHTNFPGYFDITDFTWAPLGDAGDANAPDAASLTVALEGKFGIKIVPAKDPIEVLVIDSIDRPSEN